MKYKHKGMIKELTILGIIIALAAGLTYYWGFRSYVISGEVTDLQLTIDGRYLVTLKSDQELEIYSTLFMRSEYTPEELYNTLVQGNSYNFLCWGDTPHIYDITI